MWHCVFQDLTKVFKVMFALKLYTVLLNTHDGNKIVFSLKDEAYTIYSHMFDKFVEDPNIL